MDHTKFGREIVTSLLAKLNTPISLSILIGLRYGVLITPDVDPNQYLDAHSYLIDAQALALVKKNPWILPDEDGFLSASAENVSMEKFLLAESICKETNITFPLILKNFQNRSVLETARHYVARILGDFSWSDPDFGPGSSFFLKGEFANLVDKLRTKPECTPIAHDLVKHLILDKMPLYAISCGLVRRERTQVFLDPAPLPIVYGNRLSFVPKDLRQHRAICVEPLGNMLAQKAIGNRIRSKLRNWGLDLGKGKDGTLQEHHRFLARQSSISGINATIDLSSASDTISYELVRFLLPDDWFDVLRRTRSPKTLLPDGNWIVNEKFSSMGNGYTFELESLLFYSLALAVRYHYGNRSDTVSTYGDDLIVSVNTADHLIDLLQILGFTTNKEKTFLSGNFRESCGGDFFQGIPVRPVYLKDCSNENRITFLFSLANRLREISRVFGGSTGYCPILHQEWNRVISAIPPSWRLFGPLELGDDVCHSLRFEGTGWTTITNDYVRSVRRIVRRPKRRKKPFGRDHELAAALAGVREEGVSLRNSSFFLHKRYTAGIFDPDGPGRWC